MIHLSLITMQTLILTNNTKQAEFIQKGLRYESLTVDVFLFNKDYQYVISRLSAYDGAFLFIHEISLNELAQIAKTLKEVKDIPIMPLFQSGDKEHETMLEQNIIDGYYVRPFPFCNMSLDMKYEIYRRKECMRETKYVLRDMELDIEKHQFSVGGRQVTLRNKEFALLHYMMINKGKVVSRNTILENVWDRNSDLVTNTVDVHVSQLRKKIKCVSDDNYFHTIPCLGYVLE